ncbi:MAG: hypothetical protein LBR82_11170 [Desulfovibrio sp.]|jgi:hypothetical protein|nr:hypothetical protein [Desulfovibrio sp.]
MPETTNVPISSDIYKTVEAMVGTQNVPNFLENLARHAIPDAAIRQVTWPSDNELAAAYQEMAADGNILP